MPEEEKSKRREYDRNRYQNISEDKQKKEYMKGYRKNHSNDMLKKKENDELKNVEVDVVSSRVALKDLNYIGCIFVC